MNNPKPLHITLISLNFYPEDTAIGLYSTQLAEFLVKQGSEVSVITGFPYYPHWKISEGYENKGNYYHEKKKGINIYRYKQFTPHNPTFLKRIAQIVDFTFGSRMNFRQIKNCDIVISVIPFTSSAWLGNTLSRKRSAKHWIHIQDFEFDAAFQSGLASASAKESATYKALMRLERNILNKADVVSTISHDMLKKLKKKTSSPTYYLPNWIEDQKVLNVNSILEINFDNNKFSILYAGNIGEKQDWSFFENVVQSLDPSLYEVIVVGAGAKMNVLKTRLASTMVQFYDPVPLEYLSQLLRSVDVHILFQHMDVVDTVMPSKILGMMASGKPSLLTGNPKAETATILKDSGGGFYLSTGNTDDIKEKLEELRLSPQKAQLMGEQAKAYVMEHYSKSEILKAFYAKLLRL